MKKTFFGMLALCALCLASCGDEPDANKVPTGAIGGKFSIAQHKQVYFSQGNLQYQGTNNPNVPASWRFAENQWDFVGDNVIGTVYVGSNKCSNLKISEHYTGWIDAFGHGTSGYNDKFPYIIFQADSWYPTGIANTDYDWGRYCKIDNGGEKGVWRTLTITEWEFMIGYRTDADKLYGFGKIGTPYGSVNGLILLPDNWEEVKPEALIFHSYSSLHQSDNLRMPSYEIIDPYYNDNICTAQQWKDLFEPAGAVFLPAAYYRSAGMNVSDGRYVDNMYGDYWAASEQMGEMCFGAGASEGVYIGTNLDKYASALYSVRLAQDVK